MNPVFDQSDVKVDQPSKSLVCEPN
jgi:hypothetical protein